MLDRKNICFLGAGSMAEAIIAGMLNKHIVNPEHIQVTNKKNKQRLEQLVDLYGVRADFNNRLKAIQDADIVLLAVKPTDVQEALTEVRDCLRHDQLLISVLAGVSTADITRLLGRDMPVIRTMPNTSAVVGQSATGMSGGRHATAEHLHIAKQIFESIGIVLVTEEEKLDALTGLAGSGPAYVYYLVEAMMKGGMDAGLQQEEARALSIQVIIGAAEMLKETGEDPARLREQITSPNGTTQRGIETLQEYQFEEGVRRCVANAAERSKELGVWLSAQLKS